MRWTVVVAALLVAACGAPEPQQLPEPVETWRTEELADGQVRFWPRSAPVEQGVTYHMTTYTHCGLDYLFDFDASFWVVESGPGHGYLNDPDDEGQVRLVSENRAVYISSLDGEFNLIRIDGPREIYLCD